MHFHIYFYTFFVHVVCYSFPTRTVPDDSGDEIPVLNLVDSNRYTSDGDRHFDCRTISFVIQFILLAREMWYGYTS